jgi:pilus assembly protein CpaE
VQANAIAVVEPVERQLSEFMRAAGINVDAYVPIHEVPSAELVATPPAVLVVDLRGEQSIPLVVTELRRRYPRLGIVIIAAAMDPQLMLEAIRAGVSEFVPEPLAADDLRAAIEKITGAQVAAVEAGKVLAFVGAKGGVGTTTLAVNAATALSAAYPSEVVIVDFHLGGHGDVALLLGVEPRFSVADALDNTERLDSAYLKTLVARSKGGVDVLASPERPMTKHPDAARVRTLLTRLVDRYRIVVLDVPRGEFGVLDALDPLSSVTVVLNQELPTVRRAAHLGSQLKQRYGKERVGSVVTRYDARADIGQEDIERAVDLPVWATLPSDYRKVIAAANSGRPFVIENHTRLAATIQELSKRLVGHSAKADVKAVKSRSRLGFF